MNPSNLISYDEPKLQPHSVSPTNKLLSLGLGSQHPLLQECSLPKVPSSDTQLLRPSSSPHYEAVIATPGRHKIWAHTSTMHSLPTHKYRQSVSIPPQPHASPAAPHLTSRLQEGVKCAHLQGRKVELREVRRRVRARFDLPGLDSQVHVISDWLKECSKPLSASSGDLSIFLIPMSRPELGPEYYGIDGKVKDGERPPLLTIRAERASQGKPNREIQQSWKPGRPSQPAVLSSPLLHPSPPPNRPFFPYLAYVLFVHSNHSPQVELVACGARGSNSGQQAWASSAVTW